MGMLDLIRRRVQPEGARASAITGRLARQSGAMLPPGRHIIDGRAVDVPADGGRPLALYPLPPGRHVVDAKIVIVEDIHRIMSIE